MFIKLDLKTAVLEIIFILIFSHNMYVVFAKAEQNRYKQRIRNFITVFDITPKRLDKKTFCIFTNISTIFGLLFLSCGPSAPSLDFHVN